MQSIQESIDVLGGANVQYSKKGKWVLRTVTLGNQEFTSKRPYVPSASVDSSDAFAAWWKSFLLADQTQVDFNAKPVRYVDLFSSVGGLSLGASEAITALGMRPISLLAADIDETALRVYRRNIKPREVVNESVRSMVDFRISGKGGLAKFVYDPVIRDAKLKDAVGKTDLVLAGPPCQGHSTLNNHSRGDDPKNLLYLTVPAVAVALQARHVVIENVPNVVNDVSAVVETTQQLLRNAGYRLTYAVLAADRLGWPQTRKRYFLVASRDSDPIPLGLLAQQLQRESLPVSWVLSESLDRPLDNNDVLFSVPKLSAENKTRVDYLFDQDVYDLPNEIRPDCHKDGTTYGAVYGRMPWDRPAPTITGGFLTPGRGRFVHPKLRRVMTPLEAARVQGFPDWFKMFPDANGQPSRAELAKWIGDAVPSILGFTAVLAALGGAVSESLGEVNEPIHEHAS